MLDWPGAALDQLGSQLFELGPRQPCLQMLRTSGIGGNEGETEGRFNHARQFDLRLLGGFGQPLQGLTVTPQINALIALELFGQPVDHALVKVITAQVGVACR